MIEVIIRNFLRFVVVVAFQIIILNHIGLHQLFNPFAYVFFILLIPPTLPSSMVIFISFCMGLTIDFFSSTGGIHALASTSIGYLRPHWLKFIVPRSGYDDDKLNAIQELDITRFFTYSGVLVLAHHFILFFVESLKFSELGWILTKTILSSFLSLMFINLFRLLIFKNRS